MRRQSMAPSANDPASSRDTGAPAGPAARWSAPSAAGGSAGPCTALRPAAARTYRGNSPGYGSFRPIGADSSMPRHDLHPALRACFDRLRNTGHLVVVGQRNRCQTAAGRPAGPARPAARAVRNVGMGVQIDPAFQNSIPFPASCSIKRFAFASPLCLFLNPFPRAHNPTAGLEIK